jgi:hypothetical protein
MKEQAGQVIPGAQPTASGMVYQEGPWRPRGREQPEKHGQPSVFVDGLSGRPLASAGKETAKETGQLSVFVSAQHYKGAIFKDFNSFFFGHFHEFRIFRSGIKNYPFWMEGKKP